VRSNDSSIAAGIGLVSSLAMLLGASLLLACPGPPQDGPQDELRVVDSDVAPNDGEVSFDSDSEVDNGPETDSDIGVTASACPADAGETPCEDDNACTEDVCRPDGVCAHTPNIALCDDHNACTSFDRCVAGACAGTAIDCDDDESCTADSCADGVCGHAAIEGPCDDASLCTEGDHCAGGLCVGSDVVCDGRGPCGVASCEPRTGCVVVPRDEGEPCEDDNACTLATVCHEGVCRGTLVACDDGDPCSDDYCDVLLGCASRDNHATCDDGDRCTTGDRCDSGACAGTAVEACCADDRACDDGDPCTDDRCDGASCEHLARTCDDGDACTRDACEAGQCTITEWTDLPAEGQVIEDFEDFATGDGWQFESTNALVGWRASTGWAASGAASLYCGDAEGAGYDHGATRAQASLKVLVPPVEPRLNLYVKADVAEDGSCIYDALTVLVDGIELGIVCGSGEGEYALSLAGFAGREVEVAFVFDTIDDVNNVGRGIWVDRLRLTAKPCE